MSKLRMSFWVINEDDLFDYLVAVESGEPANSVFLRMCENSRSQRVEGDE